MKQVTFFLCLILLLAACTDDTFTTTGNRVEEGLPAEVALRFESEKPGIMTRETQDPLYENQVGNIYLFVFRKDGSVFYQGLHSPGKGFSYVSSGDNTRSSGTLYLRALSENNIRMIGIANVNSDEVSTLYGITKEQLDAVGSLTQLQELVARMPESVERGAYFLMTGSAKEEGTGNEEMNIPPATEKGFSYLKATLTLRRIDAKVRFEVQADPKAGLEDFTFQADDWAVKRVPLQTYMLEREGGDYDAEDARYFTTRAREFDEEYRDPKDPTRPVGGMFAFYMPENRKTPLQHAATYADREKWNGSSGQGGENAQGGKLFVCAHKNSTYVEMTGVLSYHDTNKEQYVTADVRMTVHLGYVTSRKGKTVQPDPDDYNTLRNHFYTYRVKVRGVDDIIVEVDSEDGTEPRPGYEGDVVINSQQIMQLDAHYDRCLIQFERSELRQNELRWSVQTPFGKGVHTNLGNRTADEEWAALELEKLDYRWVKFAVNKDYGVEGSKYVAYPGDQNYDDPYISDDNQSSPKYPSHSGARLRDINQLITYLRTEANKDLRPLRPGIFDYDFRTQKYTVTLTVFIDENVYTRHPWNNPTVLDLNLWKKGIDQPDRQLHIIVGDLKTSADGNSSKLVSRYSFKQRSIRTVYDVENPQVTKAWGLEASNETGPLEAGDVSGGNSHSDGRGNCLHWLEGKRWADIISTDRQYQLQSRYNNAAYACLMRNRDLNGNGIVDKKELRWYLTSVNQLTDIYLGEYALDAQSRLYPQNAADRENKVRWHYTSSSSFSGSEPWILWAEEGASLGAGRQSIDDNGSRNTKFSYRCVRNLGIDMDKTDEQPEDLVQVSEQTDGLWLIDLTRFNAKSRRANLTIAALPNHHERSANNRPYNKFLVGKVYPVLKEGQHYTGVIRDNRLTINWKLYEWNSFQTEDMQFRDGFRIPNQRELLIMATRLKEIEKAWPTYTVSKEGMTRTEQPPFYICQTAFSLKDDPIYQGKGRFGFMYATSNGSVLLRNNSSELGCVLAIKDTD